MDQQVLQQVRTSVRFLSETYDVSVTDQVVQILGECFTAIRADPHQSWNIRENKSRLERFESDMLASLPSTLANFAFEQKIKIVTSFDLLHGMTKIVDHMCPFMKPPP
jgi:hypothetical protein